MNCIGCFNRVLNGIEIGRYFNKNIIYNNGLMWFSLGLKWSVVIIMILIIGREMGVLVSL